MNLIKTIRDKDFGLNSPAPEVYEERSASRAVIFDGDGKIALLQATNKNYHKLPGGGAEKGEDVESTLRREVLEETGCAVEIIEELAMIDEYRNKLGIHQTSYCFLAKVAGEKGVPHFEKDEIADGFKLEWMGLENAIKTLEGESEVQDYEGKFIRLRDLTFLKTATERQREVGKQLFSNS